METPRNRNGHWGTETPRFRLGRRGKERPGWTLRRGNQSGTIDFPPPGARLKRMERLRRVGYALVSGLWMRLGDRDGGDDVIADMCKETRGPWAPIPHSLIRGLG